MEIVIAIVIIGAACFVLGNKYGQLRAELNSHQTIKEIETKLALLKKKEEEDQKRIDDMYRDPVTKKFTYKKIQEER